MLGLNAGIVGVVREYEAMRNWFDYGCKIRNCQVYNFEMWSVAGSHGNNCSASRLLNSLRTCFDS